MTATASPSPAAVQTADAATPLVEIRDLVKLFAIKGGILQRTVGLVRAVDGVSFTVRRGETLGLVGESGCGKTTVGRLLLRLIEPTSGAILLDGPDGPVDIAKLPSGSIKPYRRRMQIIFQDPFASLDPRTPIGDSIGDGLRIHATRENGWSRRSARQTKVLKMMDMVGLAPYHARRYPHEFSGGQRQRIGIARALVLEPDLVVCDEPVSALDVSIQAQVLNLLADLQAEFGVAYLFISHDLGVVRHIADEVLVMYLGRAVEQGPKAAIFEQPLHPYTQALLSSTPGITAAAGAGAAAARQKRIVLKGDLPSPLDPPQGCAFSTRCPYVTERCRVERPPLRPLAGRLVACHYAERFLE
jgi:dipeptide transport system ATP-binding protein